MLVQTRSLQDVLKSGYLSFQFGHFFLLPLDNLILNGHFKVLSFLEIFNLLLVAFLHQPHALPNLLLVILDSFSDQLVIHLGLSKSLESFIKHPRFLFVLLELSFYLLVACRRTYPTLQAPQYLAN